MLSQLSQFSCHVVSNNPVPALEHEYPGGIDVDLKPCKDTSQPEA
jgi:hypothetical protein